MNKKVRFSDNIIIHEIPNENNGKKVIRTKKTIIKCKISTDLLNNILLMKINQELPRFKLK